MIWYVSCCMFRDSGAFATAVLRLCYEEGLLFTFNQVLPSYSILGNTREKIMNFRKLFVK